MTNSIEIKIGKLLHIHKSFIIILEKYENLYKVLTKYGIMFVPHFSPEFLKKLSEDKFNNCIK
jgi:hypothetical protein